MVWTESKKKMNTGDGFVLIERNRGWRGMFCIEETSAGLFIVVIKNENEINRGNWLAKFKLKQVE